MIALTATTVVENFVAAVGIANAFKARHDLARRRVPVNFFERPVCASPQWRGDAVFAVLVMIETRGFLTQIALGGRVVFVTANSHDFAVITTPGLHFNAAIEFAQDACACVPLVL